MYERLARSPRLAKKGGTIVALARGDRLLFEGCLEFQVLAGLVLVHGYTVTSSHPPLPLFSPSHSPLLHLLALDPGSVPTGHHLRPLVEALSQPLTVFVSDDIITTTGSAPGGVRVNLGAPGGVRVNLDQSDVNWLNSLSGVAIATVCAVWNLDSQLVSGLQTIPNSGLLRRSMTMVPTFRIIRSGCGWQGSDHLRMPAEYTDTIKDIVDYRGPVVLVCGDVGTGKSTFCRFLVNTFLNQHKKVGFLECDVGQTEFTVAAVTALHLLTNPVFGPAYAGHRKPYKAYFFGHTAPGDKPRYYVHLIKQLYSLFMSDIHGNGDVPLIINTCGWTKDLGVALLMDIIRLTSPTHIVRFVPAVSRRTFHPLTELLPLTPLTLTSSPGTVTLPSHLPHSVEEKWYSTHAPHLKAPHVPEKSRGERPHPSFLPDHLLHMAGPTTTTADHTRTTASPTMDHSGTIADHTRTTADHTRTTADHTRTTADHTRTTADHTRTTTGHTRTTVDQSSTTKQDHSSSHPHHKATTPSNHRQTTPEATPMASRSHQNTTKTNQTPHPHETTREAVACHRETKQTKQATMPDQDDMRVVPMEDEDDTPPDDRVYIDSTSDESSDCDVEIIGYQPPPPLTTHTPSHSARGGGGRGSGRKKNRMAKIWGTGLRLIPKPEQVEWNYQNVTTSIPSEHWVEVERCMVGRWVSVLSHQVRVIRAVTGTRRRRKDSSLMRRLAMVAHFSPLISGCGDHTHFLDKAPVMQVPWSEIAIHVLHKQVPHRAMMYAMKGNFVALGLVDPSELVEMKVEGGGRVWFMRSHTPIIEFLGMGVFRGSSHKKQLYYVTTPLAAVNPVAMDTANVLVMGETDSLFGFARHETTPTSFEHIAIGRLAWKRSN